MAGEKEKVRKDSKPKKSSTKDIESRPASSKDNLLLAGEMSRVPDPKLGKGATPSYGKPPSTPGFTPKGSSPAVLGVTPVGPGEPNMVAQIIELMNANNRAQEKKNENMLNSFMEKMGSLVNAAPAQSSAPSQPSASALPAVQAPKRKRSPSPQEEDEPLDEEEPADVEQDDDTDYDDVSDEEEQGSDLLDHFGSATLAFVPTDKQLQMWIRALKLDPDYGKEAWTKVRAKGLIKKWVDHPSAGAFTAPEPEEGVPGLVFPDHKEFEKDFSRLQDAAGTIAAIATRIMCLIQGLFV